MSTLLRLGALLLLTSCSVTLDFEDECQTDNDCLSTGWDLYCESSLCVEREVSKLIDGEMCHRIYPEGFNHERGILIGSLLPITGALSTRGPSRERAVYLAVDEINQAGGIGGRPLGVLSCDSGTDPEVATAAARHLVDVGRVSAVVGPSSSGVSTAAFTEVFHEAGVVIVSPSATAPSITSLADDNLFWRTAPSDAFQGAGIAAHLKTLNASKIALINRDDAYGNGLKGVVETNYCVGGACEEVRYFARTYRIDSDTTIATDHATIVSGLRDFAPDVVVLIGLLDDGLSFLNLMEGSGVTRFIVSDGLKNDKLLELRDAEIKANLVGTAPASPTGEGFEQFVLRYKSKYDGEEPGSYTAQSYDALYIIAYAIGAHPEGTRPSGASIAAKLRHLSNGDPYNVGEQSFGAAVEALRASPDATINIRGASGPLDFDPTTGEGPGDIEAWRLDVDAGALSSLGILFTASGQYNPVIPQPESEKRGGAW